MCDNLIFPNGVCLTHDGKHLLVASTWACSLLIFDLETCPPDRVFSSWPTGLSRQREQSLRWRILDRARGHAQSGDRSRDAFSGPRRRMTRAVAPTHWLFGNLNIGGVLKVNGAGKIVDAYWDDPSGPLYMITSMREHKGALYLGGVTNNKIGRLRLDGADPRWTGPEAIGGKAERALLGGTERCAVDDLEGVLGPNNRLEEARWISHRRPRGALRRRRRQALLFRRPLGALYGNGAIRPMLGQFRAPGDGSLPAARAVSWRSGCLAAGFGFAMVRVTP